MWLRFNTEFETTFSWQNKKRKQKMCVCSSYLTNASHLNSQHLNRIFLSSIFYCIFVSKITHPLVKIVLIYYLILYVPFPHSCWFRFWKQFCSNVCLNRIEFIHWLVDWQFDFKISEQISWKPNRRWEKKRRNKLSTSSIGTVSI